MLRLIALGALCLALSGCVYYPPYGYGYGYGYRYAPPPSYGYGYAPPAYPYGGYPAPPANGYPRTLGPNGDTPGATGS